MGQFTAEAHLWSEGLGEFLLRWGVLGGRLAQEAVNQVFGRLPVRGKVDLLLIGEHKLLGITRHFLLASPISEGAPGLILHFDEVGPILLSCQIMKHLEVDGQVLLDKGFGDLTSGHGLGIPDFKGWVLWGCEGFSGKNWIPCMRKVLMGDLVDVCLVSPVVVIWAR